MNVPSTATLLYFLDKAGRSKKINGCTRYEQRFNITPRNSIRGTEGSNQITCSITIFLIQDYFLYTNSLVDADSFNINFTYGIVASTSTSRLVTPHVTN